MADRYIETLSNYLQGCKTPEKTDFCEPHPFRLSHIQLFKILIIGLIALSLIHTLSSTASQHHHTWWGGSITWLTIAQSPPIGVVYWVCVWLPVHGLFIVCVRYGHKLINLYRQVMTINVVTSPHIYDEH